MSLVKVGWTYKFLFNTYLATLDGVYTLDKIYTYSSLLEESKNIKDLLYDPFNVPDSQYEADMTAIRSEEIYRLISVDNENIIIYAPQCVLSALPVINVTKMSKLVFTLNLGVYQDSNELISLKNNLQEQISAALGVATDPQYIAIRDVYLTDEEYSTIVAERKEHATTIINYFSENKKLQNEVDSLKAKLKAYEDILTSVSKGA